MKRYMSLISTKTKLKCMGVMILAIAGSVLASVWPVMLGTIYTKISGGEIYTPKSGAMLIGAFGLVYLLAEHTAIGRRILLEYVCAAFEAELRKEIIEKLLKMPASYYSASPSGEKTAQLNQGVSGFSQLIKIVCSDVFSTTLTAVCTLVQVVRNASGIMAGIMLLYLLLSSVISVFQIRSQNGIREKNIGRRNALDGQIVQSILNVEPIRSMNAEEYEADRLKPAIDEISETEKRHHSRMGMFDCLKQSCKIMFQVIILFVSIVMISGGNMEPGAVITVCLLFQQLIKPIDEVYRFIDEIASSLVKAKALAETAFAKEDEVFAIKSDGQPLQGGGIEFEDVKITNPEKNKILAFYRKLRIPGGKIVALQGPSGGGKTTMIRSLLRYYPYISGTIRLFGRNLASYSQRELADLMFYTPQQPFLFAGSIRENLIYGLRKEVTDGELMEALKKACLLDSLTDRTKEGTSWEGGALEYRIGEGGTGLSGGERQRLSLARVFLREAKLYILDESTANLDALTAEKVLDQIEAHAKKNNAGVIYISHDNSVVNRCDKVIPVNCHTGAAAGKSAA